MIISGDEKEIETTEKQDNWMNRIDFNQTITLFRDVINQNS